MNRRTFIANLGFGLLAAPLGAQAQQAVKLPRIGYLHPNLAASPHLAEAFRQGLRDLGYVEGGNAVIEYRDPEGTFERLPALAAELVALKVDVIVASGTLEALAAKHATSDIPIVFPTVGDPVTYGLVMSLARPGGNVTGLSNLTPELVGKCLEMLRLAIPTVSQVAILWQPNGFVERTRRNVRNGTELAGRALAMQLHFVEARAPEDFERAFSDMTRARVGAVIVVVTAMFTQQRRRLVEFGKVLDQAPLRQWTRIGTYNTEAVCEARRFEAIRATVDEIVRLSRTWPLPSRDIFRGANQDRRLAEASTCVSADDPSLASESAR